MFNNLRKYVAALLLIFSLVLVAGWTTAYAHAGLMGSTPQDGEVLKENPGKFMALFTETLEPDLINARLFDWNGNEIKMERPTLKPGDASQVNAKLPADLREGTYTIVVSVVSQDGHPIEEQLSFSIGQKSAVVVPPSETQADSSYLIMYRYLAQGIILLGGGLYLVAAAAKRYGLPTLAALIGMGRQIGWALAIIGLIFLWFLYDESLSAVSLTQALLQLDTSVLSQSPFAIMLLISFAFLLLVAIPNMVTGWYVVMWGLLISVQAFGGHAWGIAPAWLSLLLRVLHVLTVAIWMGALVYLLLTVKAVERGNEAFKRFFLQTVAVSALLAVLTGSVMLLVQTDLSSIVQSASTWSYLLYGKIASVCIMLLLAFRQTKRWRNNNGLQTSYLRWEIVLGIIAVLAGLWMSQINYPTATTSIETINQAD